MKKQIIILGVLIIAIAIAAAVMHSKQNSASTHSKLAGKSSVIIATSSDPVEATMNFAVAWLSLRQSSTTNPYQAGLQFVPMLTKSLSNRLNAAAATSSKLDPVLCQTQLPERIGAKVVYTKGSTAQVLVISRKPTLSGQALVSLTKTGTTWQIANINCDNGENAAPTGQYDFTETGSLLKSDKMPPPLDPKYWYLVYEADGQKGHTAALLFDKNSVCVAADGTQATCDPSKLALTATATVEGNMTEGGVQVKKLTLTQ